MAERALAALRRANRLIALLIGLGLLGCAGFILAEIALRRFGATLGGADEVSGYAMAIATSWGMAYCLLELGHVRIDVVRTRLGRLGRALFDLGALAALATVASVVALRCWPVLERSLANSSRANTPLETPLALVQAPWLLGWVWFALSAWATLFAAAWLVWRARFDRAEAAIGVVAEVEAAADEAAAAR